MKPFCADCKFYEERNNRIDGICRRRAPIMLADHGIVYPRWPKVSGRADWCGDFTATALPANEVKP